MRPPWRPGSPARGRAPGVACALAALVALLGAPGAGAQGVAEPGVPEPGGSDPDGWSFALGVSATASSQDASGSGQAPTRPPISGDQLFLEGIPEFRAEIASPGLGLLPADPAIFVHGAIQGWFFFDRGRALALEGDYGPLIPGTSNDPVTVGGQGSFIEMTITQGWYAGLGLSFDVPWESFPFRVKPSFDYYQQEIELEAAGQSAEILVPGVFFPPPAVLPVVGSLNVSGSSTETVHAIGPRVQLEKDVGAVGPFRAQVFVDFAAFFVVGERSFTVDASGTAGSTTFDVVLGPTIFQGGAGLRLAWIPKALRRGQR